MLALLTVLTILSAVQFVLNKSYKESYMNYQGVLMESVWNLEYETELSLLSRNYLNINLGLEPMRSSLIPNRS